MPRWEEIPPRREDVESAVELSGTDQQAMVEMIGRVCIVSVSVAFLDVSTDQGKSLAERMLIEVRR